MTNNFKSLFMMRGTALGLAGMVAFTGMLSVHAADSLPGMGAITTTETVLFPYRDRKVLFLPIGAPVQGSSVPSVVVKQVPKQIVSQLQVSRAMNASIYDPSSPIIREAISAGRLNREQTRLPLRREVHQLVAREYGADLMVTTEITGYAHDREVGTVTLALSQVVWDIPANTLRTMTVRGASPSGQRKRGEKTLAREAANAVVLESAATLAGVRVEDLRASIPATELPKPRRKNNTLRNVLLVVGAVVVVSLIQIGQLFDYN